MKKIFFVLNFIIFFVAHAQNYIKHTVSKGETISTIAQKYKVTPFDIYRINPDSQNGIKLNSILLIPKENKGVINSNSNTSESKIHIVKPKETVYGICAIYKISQEELEKNNPIIKTEGLKIGQELIIKKGYNSSNTAVIDASILHTVQAKETKYGIASKYGITVDELEKQNPEIVTNLPIGIILKINQKSTFSVVQPTQDPEKPIETTPKITDLYEYTVKLGETIYSLSRKFSISEKTLISLNPDTKDGLIEGMVLKVPASVSVKKDIKGIFKDLSKTINVQNRKELVLFLPFNVTKFILDSTITDSEKISSDRFLNMTLDFYSGALIAIDSAKTLGLNINVRILDSEETKNGTTAIATIQNGDFNKTNAVIGPFYQSNIEKVANELKNNNIPVISPLSKEGGKSFPNLYQSITTNEAVKNSMFNFIESKNGNVLLISDSKKKDIREYIQENQKNTQFVKANEKGIITADSIKIKLKSDKLNYIILDTDKLSTLQNITSSLITLSKTSQLQMVFLEENQLVNDVDFDINKLVKLNLIYPSATRNNESNEARRFEKLYKKKNNVLPNTFATRGFDLTLDTMLRISQDATFEETALNIFTEQAEYKFDYMPKVSGGFNNEGVYILYYDKDLTIKRAE